MDEALKIKERRFKSDLSISGGTYILFGVWNIVKSVIELTGQYRSLQDEMAAQGISALGTKIILAVMLIIVSAIIIPIHFFIGRSAIAYAGSRKVKKLFFILTPLLFLEAISEVPFYAYALTGESPIYESLIAAIIMQVTTAVVLFDMLRGMYVLSKIRREQAEVT